MVQVDPWSDNYFGVYRCSKFRKSWTLHGDISSETWFPKPEVTLARAYETHDKYAKSEYNPTQNCASENGRSNKAYDMERLLEKMSPQRASNFSTWMVSRLRIEKWPCHVLARFDRACNGDYNGASEFTRRSVVWQISRIKISANLGFATLSLVTESVREVSIHISVC